MAANNVQAFPPPRNQACRVYFPMRYLASSPGYGGLISTTWTTPTAAVSIDGAGYNSVGTPVQDGTSGTGWLDLTAAQMDGGHIAIIISVANSGADQTFLSVPTWNPQDITPNGVWNEQPILRYEEMVKNIVAALWNLNTSSNATGQGVRTIYTWQNTNAVIGSGPITISPNVSVTQGPIQ